MTEILYGDSPVVKQWMFSRFGQTAPQIAHGTIVMVRDGQIRGAVWIECYNGASAQVHVAGEGRGWATRRFLRAVFHYTFNVLGCRKLIAPVREVNYAARRFNESLGFRAECIIADADPDGGVIIYSLKREDCKFLENKHG